MTSAIARLRELPEAFTFSGFCKLTRFSNQAASVWLARWKEKGLIEAAGERARVYFNKLKCGEVDGSLRIAALLFEYPSALLCGESVLHPSGWITQIPARLSVAVLSRPSYISPHGFDIHGRPLSWFKKVHSALDPAPDKRIYGYEPCQHRWRLRICTVTQRGGTRTWTTWIFHRKTSRLSGQQRSCSELDCRHRWYVRSRRRKQLPTALKQARNSAPELRREIDSQQSLDAREL